MSPIDSAGITHRFGATRQSFCQTRIHFERGGPLEQPVVQIAQRLGADGGVSAARTRLISLGLLRRIVLERMNLAGLHRRLNPVEIRRRFSVYALHLVFADDALGDQTTAPHFARRWMRSDLLVERRLGERGLVGLVVTVTAVAADVDEKVLAEARA